MSRGVVTFRQADVTRALRAIRDAGMAAHVVINSKTGDLHILQAPPGLTIPEAPASSASDLDDELEAFKTEHGYG